MCDPYLYEDTEVLRNNFGIKSQKLLDDAEADYVSLRLRELAQHPLKGDYHTEHFLSMHQYIFQDVFDWAGEPRIISIYKEDVLGGMSIEYSDPFDIIQDIHHCLSDMRTKDWQMMKPEELATEFCDSVARLWKIHPFREGNTRTTITFCCQYADEMGFIINH